MRWLDKNHADLLEATPKWLHFFQVNIPIMKASFKVTVLERELFHSILQLETKRKNKRATQHCWNWRAHLVFPWSCWFFKETSVKWRIFQIFLSSCWSTEKNRYWNWTDYLVFAWTRCTFLERYVDSWMFWEPRLKNWPTRTLGLNVNGSQFSLFGFY